jgi:hypothetical protein
MQTTWLQEAQMSDTEQHIRRIPNGSIDYAYYDRLARRLRGRVTRRSIAGQRNALSADIGAVSRSTAMLATAAWRLCRPVVGIWKVPPLGPADRLRAHHGNRLRGEIL